MQRQHVFAITGRVVRHGNPLRYFGIGYNSWKRLGMSGSSKNIEQKYQESFQLFCAQSCRRRPGGWLPDRTAVGLCPRERSLRWLCGTRGITVSAHVVFHIVHLFGVEHLSSRNRTICGDHFTA